MEITIIHGQAHKGSTYHITDLMKEKLSDKDTIVDEYFLPKDGPEFCVGCCQCIMKCEEDSCPQADKVQKILASMLRSDVLIIDSPTYSFEMSGQLKTLFDHFAYIWMPHRPRKEMFSKIGIVISTAAGSGAKNVTKSMARQLFYWGVPKIYPINFSVNAACFDDIPEKIKNRIVNKTDRVSGKVKNQIGSVKPNFKAKLVFNLMRKMQISNNWNAGERDYWLSNKWLENARPWR